MSEETYQQTVYTIVGAGDYGEPDGLSVVRDTVLDVDLEEKVKFKFYTDLESDSVLDTTRLIFIVVKAGGNEFYDFDEFLDEDFNHLFTSENDMKFYIASKNRTGPISEMITFRRKDKVVYTRNTVVNHEQS